MRAFAFDDHNICWKQIDGIDHLSLSVLDMDDKHGVMHVVFKFAANRQIILHRHLTLNKTMTLQGEHRLYHVDGRLKEIRPTGRFTVAPPSDDPHREGGGDQDAVVLFAIYGDGALYEALDNEMNVVRTLCAADFASLYDRDASRNM
ncbi:regulator [Methylocystis echinoides]|uniref:regulator n=1 Tax=Methylocystis echinoides TaxID=29468 RepID=UPI003432AF8F